MIIKQQIFENRRSIPIDIQMEPTAEFFTLEPGQEAMFEMYYEETGIPITFGLGDDYIQVFEEMGTGVKVFVEEKLVYCSEWL